MNAQALQHTVEFLGKFIPLKFSVAVLCNKTVEVSGQIPRGAKTLNFSQFLEPEDLTTVLLFKKGRQVVFFS